MRIVGSWTEFKDGVVRPTILARMLSGADSWVADEFLLDIGADRTVVTAELLGQLHVPVKPPPPDFGLGGVSGLVPYVLFSSAVQLHRDDGKLVVVRGEFAAFTDPHASDVSILGRDVLDIFDVIVSRPRNEVLLLSQRHTYQVIARP